MNWIRTILDGLAMAAYFNLFAAAAALYRPRLLFPCYPPAIIKSFLILHLYYFSCNSLWRAR